MVCISPETDDTHGVYTTRSRSYTCCVYHQKQIDSHIVYNKKQMIHMMAHHQKQMFLVKLITIFTKKYKKMNSVVICLDLLYRDNTRVELSLVESDVRMTNNAIFTKGQLRFTKIFANIPVKWNAALMLIKCCL